MLILDGVYVERADGSVRFCWVKAPTSAEVTHLTGTSGVAASETFPEILGMSHSGRLSPLPASSIIGFTDVSNGR
jgi:hypothetical protein